MSNLKFYNMRSCNDDYVPEFRVSRSTCEPNEIEKKKYTKLKRAATKIHFTLKNIIRKYTAIVLDILKL